MPITHEGQSGFILHDPLALSDKTLFLPRKLAPALALCNGTRDLASVHAALMIRFGIRVPLKALEQLADQLDRACLLDNERSAAAHDAALAAYRDAPFRPLLLAGVNYTADPDELSAFLTGFEIDLAADVRASETDAGVRAIICPHIDYQRGGRVYAGLWRRAAEAARRAEQIIILGTDHNGGRLFTLTRQNYATPWGVLPTSSSIVGALAKIIGPEKAFRHELYHRIEHSIELAVVWLHAVLGDRTPELVPILVGSFQQFINSHQEPEQNKEFMAVAKMIQEISSQKPTLIIAAADLAHMGPAFAGQPLDFAGRARLREADNQLLQAICQGDSKAFFGQIKAEGDSRNICGLPPISLALQALGQTRGQITGYEICPADQSNTSSVSVAGVLLW